ncbi:MAG TPA: hypothetical protein PK573_08420 [Spirochaetota bacterium]|nr:hypothetical protein [Spirochaetota bacterium]HRZ28636.1 hypothetical protein [Spirochaetota bacterium]
MAYSDIVKNEAFLYYCQGIPSRKIAEILRNRPDCENISHSTIDTWAKEADQKGRTWDDRKAEYLAVVEKHQAGAVVRQHLDIIQETENLKETLLNDIKGRLDFKTKDAAVYAFLAVAKYQDRIKDKRQRITIEEQVTLFIEAMNEIPTVRDVLSQYWQEIDHIFQAKANQLQREKKRDRD